MPKDANKKIENNLGVTTIYDLMGCKACSLEKIQNGWKNTSTNSYQNTDIKMY